MINKNYTRFILGNIVYLFKLNTKTRKIMVRLGYLKSRITREINMFVSNDIHVYNQDELPLRLIYNLPRSDLNPFSPKKSDHLL